MHNPKRYIIFSNESTTYQNDYLAATLYGHIGSICSTDNLNHIDNHAIIYDRENGNITHNNKTTHVLEYIGGENITHTPQYKAIIYSPRTSDIIKKYNINANTPFTPQNIMIDQQTLYNIIGDIIIDSGKSWETLHHFPEMHEGLIRGIAITN